MHPLQKPVKPSAGNTLAAERRRTAQAACAYTFILLYHCWQLSAFPVPEFALKRRKHDDTTAPQQEPTAPCCMAATISKMMTYLGPIGPACNQTPTGTFPAEMSIVQCHIYRAREMNGLGWVLVLEYP